MSLDGNLLSIALFTTSDKNRDLRKVGNKKKKGPSQTCSYLQKLQLEDRSE